MVKKRKESPQRSGTSQLCPFFPVLFTIVSEVLAMIIIEKKKKERNRIQIRREKVKLSLFADNMKLYIKIP